METGNSEFLLQQFNSTIDKWIGFLDLYSFELLCRIPSEGSWSLGQVYVHIISETEYYLQQIELSAWTTDNADKEMHEDAKKMFVANSFPDMLLDSPTNVGTQQPGSKEALLQSLLFIKKEVDKLYNSFDVGKSIGKTKHPGLLFFSSLEWLQFAEMHIRHHLRQKQRIDEKLF